MRHAAQVSRRHALALSLATLASLTSPRRAAAQSSDPEKSAPPPPPLGSVLALPAITLFDGRSIAPQDLDGQVAVLYWWASWCPFCAIQSPMIEALWQAQRGRGLRVLGLSIDRRAEDATGYLAKRGFTFPSAHVTPAIARALPKPKGLPVTIVRGRDRRVLMAEGGQLFAEDVEQIARFL